MGARRCRVPTAVEMRVGAAGDVAPSARGVSMRPGQCGGDARGETNILPA